MAISPQVILFVLFMLAVVEATRLEERRQKKREALGKREAPTRPS